MVTPRVIVEDAHSCLFAQIHIEDSGYLNLMSNDGDQKDDVKVPEGELGDRIARLHKEGKELSMYQTLLMKRCANCGPRRRHPQIYVGGDVYRRQGGFELNAMFGIFEDPSRMLSWK